MRPIAGPIPSVLQTCILNCGQTVPGTRVVCIYNLWELTSSIPNCTIVDPLGAPLPQKLGNQKIDDTAAKQQTFKGFVMRSVGSH